MYLIKRLTLTCIAAFFASMHNFTNPVFILSAPRAGSSHLQELLFLTGAFWGNRRENDAAWLTLFPYRESGYSDAVTPQQFFARCGTFGFRVAMLRAILRSYGAKRARFILHAMRSFRRRLLDKTVANAFHLSVLREIFPDAYYIYLIRDGRANVSSMLEGWRSGKFAKRHIPVPATATIRYWTYPIPLGWQDQVHGSVEEACAWSWVKHNEAIMVHERDLAETGRLFRIRYEDLVAERAAVLGRISSFLGVDSRERFWGSSGLDRPSWSSVSEPRADKWKEYDREAVDRVVPAIAPTMLRLGYSL